MKRETLFLKATIVLMAIPVLALCIFWLPQPFLSNEGPDEYPVYWVYCIAIGMYVSAVPYFAALYQTLRLLSYIDKNEAFSELSVRALKKIKYCAIAFSAVYAAISPFFYLIAEQDDAPGLAAIDLVMIFASLVIAVFAAVLQKLLQNAIDIKSENDLTI